MFQQSFFKRDDALGNTTPSEFFLYFAICCFVKEFWFCYPEKQTNFFVYLDHLARALEFPWSLVQNQHSLGSSGHSDIVVITDSVAPQPV